jgi:thioredoxin 1
MAVICLGPICIPIWPLIAITVKPVWDRFVPETAKIKMKEMWARFLVIICPRRNDRSISSRKVVGTSDDQVIRHISGRDHFVELTQAQGFPVIIKFTAEWCGPCHQIEPSVVRLATKYQGRVVFAEIDIDNLDDLALELGVASIPAFLGYNGGQKIDSFTGANTQKLEDLVATVIKASKGSKTEPKKSK